MAPATRVGKNADTFLDVDASAKTSTPGAGSGAGKVLDREFFDQGSELAANAFVKGGKAFVRSTAYPHQNAVGNDGRMVRGGIKADEDAVKGKRHNKGNKRAKQRSGKGYD
ncbi:hypothetical protein RSOLAG1IB_08275 [Rhizoctonia solani AG-1 IB]|nr:hypothetical protein RSOLAG1IB_08275 [Rhizoctonia solani AG-1 IB]